MFVSNVQASRDAGRQIFSFSTTLRSTPSPQCSATALTSFIGHRTRDRNHDPVRRHSKQTNRVLDRVLSSMNAKASLIFRSDG